MKNIALIRKKKMNKWMLRIKGHPCVEDGDRHFGRLAELEFFIGDHDIQLNHIIKIDRTHWSKVTTYGVVGLIPTSALRVVLERAHADTEI